ncbi:LLM class flavin-dependent oxidoreductase [Streptomyces cacaoi]|nr:LLM class flavin-dependent oxidoreductase [Streptomyces cacaoi]
MAPPPPAGTAPNGGRTTGRARAPGTDTGADTGRRETPGHGAARAGRHRHLHGGLPDGRVPGRRVQDGSGPDRSALPGREAFRAGPGRVPAGCGFRPGRTSARYRAVVPPGALPLPRPPGRPSPRGRSGRAGTDDPPILPHGRPFVPRPRTGNKPFRRRGCAPFPCSRFLGSRCEPAGDARRKLSGRVRSRDPSGPVAATARAPHGTTGSSTRTPVRRRAIGGEYVSALPACSVLLPFLPRRPEQLLPYAALVEWTAAERLWQGQSLLVEPFQGFAAAAGSGFRVPTGTGVTLMPLRHPYEAAHQARSLALTTGEPVVAGFGPGARSFQRSLLGAPYASPLTAAREYLTVVRGLLEGRNLSFSGTYFSCEGAMTPAVTPRIELGLGVLRPGMARLAGQIADVAITWLTPASYLKETLVPALRAGAEEAGRPVPRVTAMVPMALRAPDRDPAELVVAGNAPHMRAPHYIDMLRTGGIDISGDELPAAGKRMVEGKAFLHGDPGELAGLLAEYREAGADEVVLNLTGVCNVHGPKAAMSELKTILAAVA